MKQYKRDKRSPVPKTEAVSKLMSKIKGKDTSIELVFRKALFKNSIRGYRVNYKSLPGKPDIVFLKKKVAVFVHGCYWHACVICGRRIPRHNSEYWVAKFEKNILRDEKNKNDLQKLGFKVIEIWEHEIKRGIETAILQVSDAINS